MPIAPNAKAKAAMAALGASLRRARSFKGWTQDDAAVRVGIDPSRYAKIERGEVNVSIGMFVAICEAFGFPVPRVLR